MQNKTIWIIGGIIIVVIIALLAYTSYFKGKTDSTTPMQMMPESQMPTHKHDMEKHATYYCPMHPDQTSDKPAKCPVCKMDMERRM